MLAAAAYVCVTPGAADRRCPPLRVLSCPMHVSLCSRFLWEGPLWTSAREALPDSRQRSAAHRPAGAALVRAPRVGRRAWRGAIEPRWWRNTTWTESKVKRSEGSSVQQCRAQRWQLAPNSSISLQVQQDIIPATSRDQQTLVSSLEPSALYIAKGSLAVSSPPGTQTPEALRTARIIPLDYLCRWG